MKNANDETSEFVGRETERKLLLELLEKAKEGKGQNVFISGEAGIGKSTLVEDIEAKAKRQGMTICKGECTEQEIGEPYHAFEKALADITDEPLFTLEEFVYFNEIFLISKSGLLISNVSSSTEEGIDEDILSSMLTAVQDFVKDSFGGGGDETEPTGGLGKLEYKDTKILIEHGDLVYIAAVTSGEEHPDMRKDIRKKLAEIEEMYFDILLDWDGDLDRLSGTVSLLKQIGDKKYRVKRSLDNIDLDAERLKVQTRIHELVENVASEKCMLLILDDIHWADESTVLTIPFIARNIMDVKILFCMTYRPEEVDRESSRLGETIESIILESQCKDIRLESLDEASLEALVKYQLDGGQAPDELLGKLKTETGGNPFFTIEVIRALIAEGTLVEEEGVWIMRRSPKDTVPSSVVELVSRRLETLDVDCLRLIESGAVLGRRFENTLLTSGFSMSEERMDSLVDEVVGLNILDRVGETELKFQHAKIQEVIYSGMSDRWKRMLHRNAGEALEKTHKTDPDAVLFRLAYHFGRTKEYDKGVDYSISAGYKATNNFAPREAVQFFGRAIHLIDESQVEDERYLDVVELLAELHELDGDYEDALKEFEKVLVISENKHKNSEIRMKMGRVYQSQGDYERAIGLYENAIEIAEELESSLLKARSNSFMGKIYLRKGEYDKALELQREYLAESKKTGDKREIGQAYMNMGGVFMHLRDHHQAISNWENSLGMFVEAGYDQGVANLNDNLGIVYVRIGKFDKALEHYERSREIMKKLGDAKGMSMVLNNIGILYDKTGQMEKALEFYRKSLQIKKRIGDTVGVANIYNNIGSAFFDNGQLEDAIQNFNLNLELMEKVGDTWGVAQALSNMAESEQELGKTSEAKEHCQRSLSIAEKHSFKDIIAYDYMLMGTISCLDDDKEAADKYFADSLSLAKETEEPLRIGWVYLSIARSFVRRGERDKATDNFANALRIFEEAQLETLAKTTRSEMQKIIETE